MKGVANLYEDLGCFDSTFNVERDHGTELAHLFLGQFVVRVTLEAGIVDRIDRRVARQELCQAQGVVTFTLNTNGECL